MTRRTFSTILAGSGAALAQEATPQRRGTMPEIPPFQEPLAFTKKPVPLKVEPLPMTQVRVLAGVYKDAQEWNRGYLSRLPADRLVHNFRVNAGLASSAVPFGGWEEPKGELRG